MDGAWPGRVDVEFSSSKCLVDVRRDMDSGNLTGVGEITPTLAGLRATSSLWGSLSSHEELFHEFQAACQIDECFQSIISLQTGAPVFPLAFTHILYFSFDTVLGII